VSLWRRAIAGAVWAGLLVTGRVVAQVRTAPVDEGEAITVTVLTMGQGEEVWERFGHNALRVQDRLHGTDVAYNWGMFSFEQENFFLNFARGRMLYWMKGIDGPWTIQSYAEGGRSVTAQELALTSAEKVALRNALQDTDTDANRFYLYDYYRDNCSTRVRDAVDRAIGGQLKQYTDTIATRHTWRSLTREQTISDLPVYLGLQALLGRPVDRPLTAWEAMFLPFRLHDWLARASRRLPDGQAVPLVVRTDTLARQRLVVGGRDHVPGGMLGLWGLGVAGAIIMVGSLAWLPTLSRALASAWALFAGLGGVLLVGLWTLTNHAVAASNENVLVLSVAALPLAFLVWQRRAGGLAGQICGVVVALSAALAGVLVFSPLHQRNAEILALAVPLDLALALVVRSFAQAERG
jgi:hypothetical protein